MLRVMIDVDGVLASFNAGMAEIAWEMAEIRLPIDPMEIPTWNYMKEELGLQRWKEAWEMITQSDTFWQDLPPLVKPEVFARINAIPAEVYFITSRPGNSARAQTLTWLRYYGISAPNVICADHKGQPVNVLEIRAVLEDSLVQATSIMVACGLKTEMFLLNRPYNSKPETEAQSLALQYLTRVNSVEEFLEAVERKNGDNAHG